MLGMRGVAALVEQMLQTDLGPKILEMRARQTPPLTGAQLPTIKSWRPAVPRKASLSDYPCLYLVGNGGPSTKSQQKTRFGVQYAVQHQLTIVTLVRSTSVKFTTDMQQDIALAVKETLLQSMQLAPLNQDQSARIEQDSIRERFSGIESYAGRDNSTYGGCMTDVTVTTQEIVPRLPAPLGQSPGTKVTAVPLH